MKAVLLAEVTEEQMKEFYKLWTPLKKEFERVRPNFYEGRFNGDPLLAHYKQFLADRGVKHIALKDK